MALSIRIKQASKAALIHAIASVIVALAAAWLVFVVWYPSPYDELTGGRGLFILIVVVDVVCGPLLTLVLYDPAKARSKWHFDLSLILFVQLAALVYGLFHVSLARPIFLSFEGNRFRVVQAMDVKPEELEKAAPEFRQWSYSGPRLIGARLSKPTDPEFLASVTRSLKGEHPSFRPERWVMYEAELTNVRSEMKPLSELRIKNPAKVSAIDEAVKSTGQLESNLAYLPLVKESITDWIVLLDRQSAKPVAYLQMDGW
jgi:hypothetical protein